MAREKKIGIYLITSPTSRRYVGQSVDIEKRMITYRNNLCINQPRLKNSINKYGYENHKVEILEECSKDILNKRERYWQEHYNSCGVSGLNCMLTTDGNVASRHSEETREKIGASQRGIKKKPLSDETKRKLSILNTGRKMDDEFKEKCRQRMLGNPSRTGMKNSEETNSKISSSLLGNKRRLGHKHSDERKAQISAQQKGNKYRFGTRSSEETKIRISENSKKAILIFNTETGIFYNSLKSASDSINSRISSAHISRMIKGRWTNKTSFIFA